MNRYANGNLVYESVLNTKAWDLAREAIQNIPTPEDKATAWQLAELVNNFKRLGHRCLDCEKNFPEIFMVTDDLWEAHGVGPKVLCIKCFSGRMPRPLVPSDFKHVPCNDLLLWAMAMAR